MKHSAISAADRHGHALALPPAAALEGLKRRHIDAKSADDDGALDPVFGQLDSFLARAATMVAEFARSGTITPAARLAFEAEREALMQVLAEAESEAARPAGSSNALVLAERLTAIALLRADAMALHEALLDECRRARYRTDDRLELRLIEAGFADPISAARRLRDWEAGIPAALRRGVERKALGAVLPRLLDAIGRLPDPDAALSALDAIVGRLPVDTVMFGAFEARPSLLESLIDMIGHAPALSRFLVAEPAFLARLIDTSAYAPLPPMADIEAEMAVAIAGRDVSASAARLIEVVNGHRFGLALKLIEGTCDPLELARHAADLAQAALRVVARTAIAEFEEAHGRIAGSELLILGTGGEALIHRSELDLVYLFTGDHRASSDGRKPLDAHEYFGRIAQRITRSMTTATTLGPLYAIGTGLRPGGADGLLACSTLGFDLHHAERAWTWEHMALTRIRPLFGSEQALAELRRTIACRLRQSRNRATLIADALKLRGDLMRSRPPRGPFDIRSIDGGLTDLEFAVHVNQLRHHVGLHPGLRTALRSLAAAGLIDPAAIWAHDLLSRMHVTLPLLSAHRLAPASESRALAAQICGQPDWERLTEAYEAARAIVRAAWQRTISSAPA